MTQRTLETWMKSVVHVCVCFFDIIKHPPNFLQKQHQHMKTNKANNEHTNALFNFIITVFPSSTPPDTQNINVNTSIFYNTGIKTWIRENTIIKNARIACIEPFIPKFSHTSVVVQQIPYWQLCQVTSNVRHFWRTVWNRCSDGCSELPTHWRYKMKKEERGQCEFMRNWSSQAETDWNLQKSHSDMMFGISTVGWVLIFIYVAAFLGLLVYFCADPEKGTMGQIMNFCSDEVPAFLSRMLHGICGHRNATKIEGCLGSSSHYLCYERNPCLQVFYLAVVLGAYAMVVMYGYPMLPCYYLDTWHWYTGFASVVFCIYLW
jgi:hypothetical protein